MNKRQRKKQEKMKLKNLSRELKKIQYETRKTFNQKMRAFLNGEFEYLKQLPKVTLIEEEYPFSTYRDGKALRVEEYE